MAVVTTCPSSLSEKNLASKRLGCKNDIYGNNQYICAPNEAKTSLVELCNDGIMGILEEGNCLSVAGTKYEAVNCLHFPSGCPKHYYWSYEVYMHSACQKINTQLHCYEMDPACQLQVHHEVTEAQYIRTLGSIIAAAFLVAAIFISLYFGMKFGRSFAPSAEEIDRLGGDDVTSATDIGPPENEELILGERCTIKVEGQDIGPPENEELILGERCTIKVEGQAREQT